MVKHRKNHKWIKYDPVKNRYYYRDTRDRPELYYNRLTGDFEQIDITKGLKYDPVKGRYYVKDSKASSFNKTYNKYHNKQPSRYRRYDMYETRDGALFLGRQDKSSKDKNKRYEDHRVTSYDRKPRKYLTGEYDTAKEDRAIEARWNRQKINQKKEIQALDASKSYYKRNGIAKGLKRDAKKVEFAVKRKIKQLKNPKKAKTKSKVIKNKVTAFKIKKNRRM